MSPVLIGLVIVGFATSAPVMLISAVAAIDRAPALAVGNALGSNIANLGMVLGAAVLLTPLAVHSQTLRQEFPAVLAATGLTYLLFLDNELSRFDAIVLLSALAMLTVWLVLLGMRSSVFDPLRIEYGDEFSDDLSVGRAVFWLVIGLVTLLGGSELMVNGAIDAARRMGISELVLGVLLAVIGIAGTIQPHELTSGVLTLHYPLMAIMTLAVFVLTYNRRARLQLTRPVGAMLVLTFLGYQGYAIWSAMT